jgi:hypothetical protein
MRFQRDLLARVGPPDRVMTRAEWMPVLIGEVI